MDLRAAMCTQQQNQIFLPLKNSIVPHKNKNNHGYQEQR
jgi:hypothetical protein